jgi:hypothetical protein
VSGKGKDRRFPLDVAQVKFCKPAGRAFDPGNAARRNIACPIKDVH